MKNQANAQKTTLQQEKGKPRAGRGQSKKSKGRAAKPVSMSNVLFDTPTNIGFNSFNFLDFKGADEVNYVTRREGNEKMNDIFSTASQFQDNRQPSVYSESKQSIFTTPNKNDMKDYQIDAID